ncbi:hypothetical protein BR93DRAFT_21155 [Coniochaeta sp. PMI_546]|nr:hypothetical protein BR93DRAFT_21155 [Coniochaeta sp. PMI_546]
MPLEHPIAILHVLVHVNTYTIYIWVSCLPSSRGKETPQACLHMPLWCPTKTGDNDCQSDLPWGCSTKIPITMSLSQCLQQRGSNCRIWLSMDHALVKPQLAPHR